MIMAKIAGMTVTTASFPRKIFPGYGRHVRVVAEAVGGGLRPRTSGTSATPG